MTFEFLSTKIRKYHTNLDIDAHSIQIELKDFASKWSTIKEIAVNSNQATAIDDKDEDLSEESETKLTKMKCKNTCKNCIICCFCVLTTYRLHTLAYPNLYIVYKYVLTLSCTQVRCETTFSKLKYILNRLRNCLSQEHLEAFLLMSVEKDILFTLDNDNIIDNLAQKSSYLKKLLL